MKTASLSRAIALSIALVAGASSLLPATAQAADIGMAPDQRLTRSQVQAARRRKHAGETQAIR